MHIFFIIITIRDLALTYMKKIYAAVRNDLQIINIRNVPNT